MANETILIVDADKKSQKVLEVSFKKAGYRVVITDGPDRARKLVEETAPDIIIADTQFGDGAGTGFEFLADLKSRDTKSIPFIFLTEERALPQKMKGFELGADDYLTKPIYIKEVTTRVQLLLQKRAKEQLTEEDVEELEGELVDITMIDLLQTIEEELRSGTIHLTRENQSAVIYFREGNILDAICGKLQGEEAIYRLMLWPDGQFVLRYHEQVRRVDRIEKDSGALLLEGIRRLDQYNELIEDLPGLHQVFEADLNALSGVAEQLPDEVGRILRLFDGLRSIRDVSDGSPVDDVTTLKIVQKLLEDGFLVDVTPTARRSERPSRSNLAAWLDGVKSDTSGGPIMSREDTSPKFGSSIAQMAAERKREESERSTTLKDVKSTARDTDPFGSRLQAEDVPKRTTLPLKDAFDSIDGWDDEDDPLRDGRRKTALQWERPRSDWNVRFDPGAPDEAIREIEAEERRRREEEARQLTGETARESDATRDSREATLQFAPAQERRPEDSAVLRQIEEDERRRREEEARRLQAQLMADPPRRLTDELPSQAREPEPEPEPELVEPRPTKRKNTPLSSPAMQREGGWDALAASSHGEESVSEADVFDDSDELERAQLEEGSEPEDSSQEPDREKRATLDIRPPRDLYPLGEPSSPEEVEEDGDEPDVDPGELFDGIGHEDTGPVDDDEDSDVESLEFEVIDVLPTVERQSRDNELVTRSYDLSLRPTIKPSDIDGRVEAVATRTTMELRAPDLRGGAEGKFFSSQPDDDFEFTEPQSSNTGAWILLIVGVIGLAAAFMLMQSDDPKPVDPPNDTITTVQNDTVPPVVETTGSPEGVATEEATLLGASQGEGASQEATALARMMSGADLVPDMGSTDAGTAVAVNEVVENPPVEKPPVEKPPVEKPPVEKPPVEKPPVEKPPVEKPPAEKITKASSAEVRKAERLVDRGQYDEALELLRQLTKLAPRDKKVAYLHGLAAFSSNRTGEAVQNLSRAERLGYRTAPLYLDLAAAYQLDGQKSQAKWAYEKFLELKPSGKQADQVRSILETRF